MENNVSASGANQKNSRMKYIRIGILLAVVLIFILIADITVNSYVRRILNLCAIYTILGLSMNLVNGFTGLFSLGQAGFMAVGAYCVAVFTVPVESRAAMFYLVPQNPAIANLELPFVVALLLGGFVSAFFAFLIGFPVLRLKGDYLAIATLGFSEIIRIVFTNTQTITNGALGIKGIPTINRLWWTFGIAIIVVIFMFLLINSTYGRAFKAIREDEIAAEAMGISLFKHKVLSFTISGFLAGIGGGLFAALLGTVDPKQFYFTLTYNFLLIIVLGGMGSISGTIISAFIVTAGLEWLRLLDEPHAIFGWNVPLFRPGLRMVVFSILLMAIVLFWSRGLMGNQELSWEYVKRVPDKLRNTFRVKSAKGGAAK